MSRVKTHSEETAAPLKKDSHSFETAINRLSMRQNSNERRRSFAHILASPVRHEPQYAYPLLVWLHGAGKSERELFDVVPKISSRNYVATAPRGFSCPTRRIVRSHINGRLVDEKSWTEPCNDWPETEECISEAENLVFASIEEAMSRFNINSRRIFLLGRGSGATMAMQVAFRNPGEFAGVVSIDGSFPSLDNLLLRNWRSLRDLPILMTTGRDSASLSAKQLRLMHTAGMTVVVRQYNENPRVPNSLQLRMDKILTDVNNWTMKRELNPLAPIAELFSQG